MASEAFDGSTLMESLTLLKESRGAVDDFRDDISECGEYIDSDEDRDECIVDSLRRFHVAGAAARVSPFTHLTDHVHNALLSNTSFVLSNRVPLMAQYLIPLLMAEYDALVVAPPGKAQIEALLIPIINKIILSLADGLRSTEKRPRAVILSSNMHERKKISDVIKALTKDLPITSAEVRSIDGLNEFSDFDRVGGQLDILVTTPAAYIAFTRRNPMKGRNGEICGKYPAHISTDRLRYLVVFELEELCDAGGDYSRIIANHRKEKEFTLVMVTHTSFTNRGPRKKLNPEHSERRSKLENLLNDDYGLVMVDSTLCIRNYVVVNDSLLSKLEHLRAILEDNQKRCYNEAKSRFEKRVVIVVPNDERARFVKAFLTSGGRYHKSLINPRHIVHLESDMGRRDAYGKWKDPMKKMRTGQVIGVITSNIHGMRMAHSVVDKVIFFDVVPSMHSLVLNCSKIIDNRRNIILLERNDFRNKREELHSLVQYLKDVDSEIPAELREFDSPPASVKSIYA